MPPEPCENTMSGRGAAASRPRRPRGRASDGRLAMAWQRVARERSVARRAGRPGTRPRAAASGRPSRCRPGTASRPCTRGRPCVPPRHAARSDATASTLASWRWPTAHGPVAPGRVGDAAPARGQALSRRVEGAADRGALRGRAGAFEAEARPGAVKPSQQPGRRRRPRLDAAARRAVAHEPGPASVPAEAACTRTALAAERSAQKPRRRSRSSGRPALRPASPFTHARDERVDRARRWRRRRRTPSHAGGLRLLLREGGGELRVGLRETRGVDRRARLRRLGVAAELRGGASSRRSSAWRRRISRTLPGGVAPTTSATTLAASATRSAPYPGSTHAARVVLLERGRGELVRRPSGDRGRRRPAPFCVALAWQPSCAAAVLPAAFCSADGAARRRWRRHGRRSPLRRRTRRSRGSSGTDDGRARQPKWGST